MRRYVPSVLTNLGGEDVAGAPGHLSSQLDQSLDEDSGLDSHVKTSGNPGTLQGLLWSVRSPEMHQTGHLILSNPQLLATPVGQGDVS